MTSNQKIPQAFMSPLGKKLAVSAASLLTTGALLGVGVAAASAAPLVPATGPGAATSSASLLSASTGASVAATGSGASTSGSASTGSASTSGSATASTTVPTPTTPPAPGAKLPARITSFSGLAKALRVDLFRGEPVGAKVQFLAASIVGDQAVFALLPANLQSDLTALKNAPAAQQVPDAQKIKTTALDGGYGQKIERIADHLAHLSSRAAAQK